MLTENIGLMIRPGLRGRFLPGIRVGSTLRAGHIMEVRLRLLACRPQ
jgi:hypothetical protein